MGGGGGGKGRRGRNLGEASSKCRWATRPGSVKLLAPDERTTPMSSRTGPREDDSEIGTLDKVHCIRLSTCSRTLA